MKYIARTLALAILGLGALTAHAQNRTFIAVDRMHIPESQNPETYIATEKLWQRLHQRAVDTGICLSWTLYKVENGGRTDFATVRVYNSLDKMSNPWPDSVTKDLYNAEESKTMNHTGETRDLIHTEVSELEAATSGDGKLDPSDSISVEYMKPKLGKGGEYYNMEKNTYSKIHQARVKAGEMKNWYFLSRMFPSGMDSEFDYITVNIYPKNGSGWNSKIAETALGKEEAAKLGDPGAVRTMIRTEIWHPLLTTTPAKK
jgi:hypothetical protein